MTTKSLDDMGLEPRDQPPGGSSIDAGRCRRGGAASGSVPVWAGPRATTDASDPRKSSPRAYRMKKSINLWAFPYPQRMTLARMPATCQGRGVRRNRAEL